MTASTEGKPVRDGFATWASAYYAALCVAFGIQIPFFPLWLEAKNVELSAIGFVIAAPMAVRIVAVPLVARAADRVGALRGALMAASVAAAVGYAAVAFASGFVGIFCTVAIAAVAFTPTGPLADAYALRGLERRGRAYGPVRLWGSAAFIAANLGAGVLATIIAPGNLIWLIIAAYVATAIVSLGLRPLAIRGAAPDDAPSPPSGAPSRPASFYVVAAAASLIQASHAVYYGFSTLDWTSHGLDGIVIGALWALGVAAEVTLFAISARLAIGPIGFLAMGAAGAALRWTAMAFDPPFLMLPLLQLLHGLSFAATHLGCVQFIARTTPASQAASAQGDFASLSAIAMAIAMSSAGILYGAFASQAYGFMAIAAGAGGCMLLFAQSPARRGSVDEK
jgi:MFS transporter, PPP family, 3-phenylpropionic acid transporter